MFLNIPPPNPAAGVHSPLLIVNFDLQLIAAYSSPPPPPPPPPPEAAESGCDSASMRLDFKDSDMKRLSMEIERER